MTALHERLLALHKVIGGLSTGLTGNTVLLSARQAAEIHATLSEAATALQSSGGEVGCRTPIAWAVETEHYGRCYSFSNEFIETFPNAPVSFGNLYLASPAQPSGFVLVPVEPTEAMIEAAWDSEATDYVGEHKRIHNFRDAYIAAITAAPAPIEQEG